MYITYKFSFVQKNCSQLPCSSVYFTLNFLFVPNKNLLQSKTEQLPPCLLGHWENNGKGVAEITAYRRKQNEWKSARRRRKHCALAVVRRSQKFRPAADPFPSWRWSLPLPTNPVWWGSMHAISSYRDKRLTNTYTNPQTNKTGWLQYTVPQIR